MHAKTDKDFMEEDSPWIPMDTFHFFQTSEKS